MILGTRGGKIIKRGSVGNPPGLIWSDEFNGPAGSAPNPANWSLSDGERFANTDTYYTPRSTNVRLSGNSTLILEAKKESYMGHSYTSGGIDSYGLKSFQYGRFETRAKLPLGRGTFPAFWAQGNNILDVGWPACGEADFMEYVGWDTGHIYCGNVHTTTYNVTGGPQNMSDPENWHVYSGVVTADKIECFIDGAKVTSFANDGSGSNGYPFNQPIWMLWNLGIGGPFGGNSGIDDTIFAGSVIAEIDYVRVYSA